MSRAAISEIINRGARLIVMTQELEAGGRRIMGYSVSEPDQRCLHWLYMKDDYRGVGYGKRLLAETVLSWPTDKRWIYTHRTPASSGFLGEGFQWNPIPARVKH